MISQRHHLDLFLETSLFVGRVGHLLRAQRKLILHLARDPLLLAIQFGGIRHVEAAVGIE